jgi:hypothetical protein
MRVPAVSARVEEPRAVTSVGIDARKIGAFVKITFRAGECEIVRFISVAVLAGNNVFDVKSQGGKVLPQPAVFATVSSASADELGGRRVHQAD